MGGMKLSEIMSGSSEEQDQKLGQLVQSALAPDPEQLALQRKAIQARITSFERRYEMSSASMRQKLSRGEIKETADICSWLMLLKVTDARELKK